MGISGADPPLGEGFPMLDERLVFSQLVRLGRSIMSFHPTSTSIQNRANCRFPIWEARGGKAYCPCHFWAKKPKVILEKPASCFVHPPSTLHCTEHISFQNRWCSFLVVYGPCSPKLWTKVAMNSCCTSCQVCLGYAADLPIVTRSLYHAIQMLN